MYEIAEPPSNTSLATVQPTTGLAEIRNRGQFTVDGASGVPAGVESVAGLLRRVFVLETRVNVAD